MNNDEIIREALRKASDKELRDCLKAIYHDKWWIALYQITMDEIINTRKANKVLF